MNWLTNFVRPKLRELVGRKEVPDNLWHKCPGCGQMLFHRDLDKTLRVCQHCGHHLRIPAKTRLAMLFDDGAFQTADPPKTVTDPLKFRDSRKYSDRLKEARDKSGGGDALTVAHGTMGGQAVVIAAFDFGFMGGSMGVAVGEGLLIAARLAVEHKASLITVTSSGGARMQEGILSLMQMTRATIAIDDVRAAGLPYISVLADPTTGGVSASFAMLGDIAIAEPGALIGFAGGRVIEQTIRETLPEGFQRSEYQLDHGMVDMVVHRHDLRDTIVRVLRLLRQPALAADALSIPPMDMAALPAPAPDAVEPGQEGKENPSSE